MNSLWGADFEIRPSKPDVSTLLNKVTSPQKITMTKSITSTLKSKKIPIKQKLDLIEIEVNKVLSKFKKDTVIITDVDTLNKYIDAAINNDIIAIDTETNNSLDPFTCKLMGLCLYTLGEKNVYIPINHVNPYTGELLPQLTEYDCNKALERLVNTKIIMHNAKFDIKVLYCTCKIKLTCYWDTLLAAKMLDENKPAGLKEQYRTNIDSAQEKYDIEHLFKGIEYAVVPPELFALYAATDPYITYKLYEFQRELFKQADYKKIFEIFMDVEMQVLPIVIDMELTGIELDLEYCDRLKNKYSKLIAESEAALQEELNNLRPIIDRWRLTPEATAKAPSIDKKTNTQKVDKNGYPILNKSLSEKLPEHINLSSPTQLAIILYDILNVGIVDKKSPRGTGKEILETLSDKVPLCNKLLEHRKLEKLMEAFIETLPTQISPWDNRLHATFDQLGTKTGRFSSKAPNLQQIPSKNKEIRLMFKASPGYVLVGSDYSQQEPRLLTAYSGDEKLLKAYIEGKDMYAVMGTGVYKNDYWDNMEHFEDGSPNIEGKNRRKKMKTLLLGMMYGMGPATLSERMGVSKKEATTIINDFYEGFPKVTEWMRNTETFGIEHGYVEDFWGRRRHLPDLLLPEYSLKGVSKKFNPLIGSNGHFLDQEKINYYYDKLVKLDNNGYNKDTHKYTSGKSVDEYQKVKDAALKEGIQITKNGGFISRAKRQCVNARIQGGAATMTKKAMISIANDDIIKSYGFKLLIGVHDELIGECKEEFATECAERLSYLMRTCVPEISVPLKCDPTIEKNWNEEDFSNQLKNEFEKVKDFKTICDKHLECTVEQLKSYLDIN